MDASSRIVQKLRRLLQILQPPDAFLLLDGNSRRVDFFLERGGPFEFLSGPEFDGRQPERQALGRYREARMHQDAANRVRSQATLLVPSAVYVLGYADRFGVLSLVREFGRVMQDQNDTIGTGDTITSRLKMTGQNVRLADPVIREKSIGSLGVGPILANQRNALPHGAPDLGQQFAESITKPRIPKFTSGGFSINPAFRGGDRLGSPPRRSIPQYQTHGAPFVRESGAQQ
jgi:hypothetical protein